MLFASAAEEKCATCLYFEPKDKLCVRYPPTALFNGAHGGTMARFPEVKPEEWCGEWKKN
jgi:hypothetical protein